MAPLETHKPMHGRAPAIEKVGWVRTSLQGSDEGCFRIRIKQQETRLRIVLGPLIEQPEIALITRQNRTPRLHRAQPGTEALEWWCVD